MVARRHRLSLEDRGHRHIRRWRAVCTCGWRSIPFNLKRTAAGQGAMHGRTPAQRLAGGPGPRPVTPPDKLPAWPASAPG